MSPEPSVPSVHARKLLAQISATKVRLKPFGLILKSFS